VTAPTDATLKEYVRVIPGVTEAILEAQSARRAERRHSLLIDPAASIEAIHRRLDCLNASFETATLSDRSSLVNRELKHTKEYLENVLDL
jgi:hypothetical protein